MLKNMRAEVMIMSPPISSQCFICGETNNCCRDDTWRLCVCVWESRHFLLFDCVYVCVVVCFCMCPCCSQRAVEETNCWNVITLSCLCVCVCVIMLTPPATAVMFLWIHWTAEYWLFLWACTCVCVCVSDSTTHNNKAWFLMVLCVQSCWLFSVFRQFDTVAL